MIVSQLEAQKFNSTAPPCPTAKPGSYVVAAAGNGGCSSARSCRSAVAAAHTCHLNPRMRPRTPDHGRTVPTLAT